ncbi:MAG TPA: serine hydroxymethyltransferase [Pseudorhodoplanes sp.]|nr:serine hydroxymethyltransferase [Pseudorhodoplanes sp.]
MAGQTPREVLFEFTVIGPYVKVVAMDAATGVEVSVTAPANASRADLQKLALRKLDGRLSARGSS